MKTTPAGAALRWGLIGPGRIATQFAGALKAADTSCLYAVVGRNRQKAQLFARDHGAPQCYSDHRALLDDPNVDAVYIATPHRSHYELTRACLLAGKPVLCEKPLTVNAREAQALVELSRQRGVFLMEALWTRFLPIYQDIRQWLDSGSIGTVQSIDSSFGFVFPRDPHDRLLNPDLAGGALLDLGVYNLSMSQWVYGAEPVSHSIDGHLGDTGVDEHSETMLRYSEGRLSTFAISMTQQLPNDFTIYGSHGHIRIHPMFWNATRATLDSGDAGHPVSITRELRATGLEYEIDAAADCIRKGLIESVEISHDHTLATMMLMDALRRDIGLSYDFE